MNNDEWNLDSTKPEKSDRILMESMNEGWNWGWMNEGSMNAGLNKKRRNAGINQSS